MQTEYSDFRTQEFFEHYCGTPKSKNGSNIEYRCQKANGKAHSIYVSDKTAVWVCHHANCPSDTGCPVQKGTPRHFLTLVEPGLSDRDAFELLNRYGRRDPRGGQPSNAPTSGKKTQATSAPPADEKPAKVWRSLEAMKKTMPGWDLVEKQAGSGGRFWGPEFVYQSADGSPILAVFRIDGPKGKAFVQAHPVSGGWVTGAPKHPRPLFRLTELLAEPDKPVIVVEGEKCVLSLKSKLPKAVITTSSGGAKAPGKTDWSQVSGRKVIILPDNDQAGRDFATTVTDLCRKAGAAVVAVVEPFYAKGENDGRDVADFIKDGGHPDTIRDYIKKAISDSEPVQGIPTIRIEFGPGTLSKMAHEGVSALLVGKAGIYQRSGDLVMIRADEKTKLHGIRWPSGEPRIVAVSPSIIRDKLDQMAVWERFDTRAHDWVSTRPPRDAVETIMGQEWDNIPTLSMIFETPTMRLDGSIVDKPGWDDSTGIFFMPRPGEHWNIPRNPTPNQIKAAKEALLEVHCDFPFEKECHRAATIAGILTLLSGLTYLNRPLFMWDANVRGAGKTLGADVSSLIATGRDFPKMTQGTDENEDRKRITTLAMSGARAVLVDNIVGKFGNAAIDAAITAEGFWEDRLLGQNRTWKGPLFITWFATGNNIEVQGDLSRRVIPVKIMSEEERPEHRTGYKHADLRSWVRAERVRLATAGLTILRGYTVAGKPDQKLINFGSFEEWSTTVRNAVVWAGLADPYEGNEDVQQKADSDAVAIGNLLQAWYATFREMPVTLAKIAKMEPFPDPENQAEITQNDALEALKEALTAIAGNERGEGWNLRKAGQVLQKFEKRVIGGLRIEQGPKINIGLTWKVRRMPRFEAM